MTINQTIIWIATKHEELQIKHKGILDTIDLIKKVDRLTSLTSREGWVDERAKIYIAPHIALVFAQLYYICLDLVGIVFVVVVVGPPYKVYIYKEVVGSTQVCDPLHKKYQQITYFVIRTKKKKVLNGTVV